MAETYCGKSCAECEKKEQLNCKGCKYGPGRQFGGDCKLAKCVMEKGHETCDTCGFHENCSILRSRETMPEDRCRKLEAEAARKAEMAKQAPMLAKWLWLIFWLIIPNSAASILTNQTVVQYIPGLLLPGQIINIICVAVYGIALWKLSETEESYKKAGICRLISGAVGLGVSLAVVAAGVTETPPWTLLLTIPAAILGLVSEYNEYKGHAAILVGVDDELSEKWTTLWKWFIGLFLGMLGCIVVILILPILGLLALIGAAIGTLVVAVLKLVYLYRTAKFFREYSVAE